jgi:hypothetical protein
LQAPINTDKKLNCQPFCYFDLTTQHVMLLATSFVSFQAQMPLQVELEPHKQCSFFSFCSLDDVTVGENGVTQQLIDVWIDASTLSRHNQTTTTSLSHAIIDPSQAVTMMRPEQHFYPSSLAFDLICLLDQGFVHASHLGLQRKVKIY